MHGANNTGVQCGAQQTAHELPAILRAAEQAAAKSDWPAVKQYLGHLKSPGLASSLDLGVQALLLQAEALGNLQQQSEALEALDLALQLRPTNAKALWQRAAAHAAAGHHMACFKDLCTLGQHHPTHPGLTEALQQAARAVAQQQAAAPAAQAPPRKTYIHTTRRTSGSSTTIRAAAAQGRSEQQHAYATLGLQPGASLLEVREAYKQLAMQLHPDKWGLAPPEQQAAAEAQFKQVAAAYQILLDVATP